MLRSHDVCLLPLSAHCFLPSSLCGVAGSPFPSKRHVRHVPRHTVNADRAGYDTSARFGALWTRDQVRRTRGVAVGGAVPGGLLFWKCARPLSAAVKLMVTGLASGIDVTVAFALSVAVSDACRIDVS